MRYNRYSIQITIRIVLIFFSLLALSYYIPQPNRLVTILFIALLVVSQTVALIRFVNKINSDFARFLIELREKDASELHFPESLKKNFKNFRYSFQQISDEIKKTRIEKIGQEQYLSSIINTISDGLITFDEDGKVDIINNAAKHLLGIKFLNSVWDLDSLQAGLAKKLVLASPGQQKLIKVQIADTTNDFLFKMSELKIENQIIKILTFQDLKKELEEREIISWKKLIRVLTHEMMNSLTPITTLSVAVRRILKSGGQLRLLKELNEDDINDIYKNNETIENRSKGLLEFINQYRQITKIPELRKEQVDVHNFLHGIVQLFSESIKELNIEFTVELKPADLTFWFDKKLIEQVVINLVKNSVEALESCEAKKIQIIAEGNDTSMLLKVQDNGQGIPSEVKDDIFIPFFTTKEQGSGIGLSLSKEIMQKHNGDIYFEANAEKGTSFYLKF